MAGDRKGPWIPSTARLWEYLEFQGRSREWLARVTDKSRSYVYKVRMGRLAPSPAFRRAAALALGVPDEYLFAETEIPPVRQPGQGAGEKRTETLPVSVSGMVEDDDA